MNSIVYVGMDVHKEQYTLCCYSYAVNDEVPPLLHRELGVGDGDSFVLLQSSHYQAGFSVCGLVHEQICGFHYRDLL